jgi:hypothetical protein
MPLHVSSTCAHHQDVKIALHSLWYHHTYTRDCVMQFWPDDEHMCSKHVEAWNKLILKQKFCEWSWLITDINILRCTVSKMSKFVSIFEVCVTAHHWYSDINSQLDATKTSFIDNCNQLNMFRTIISPIPRSTRLCLQLVV